MAEAVAWKKVLGDLAHNATSVEGQLEILRLVDEAYKRGEHRKCIQLCDALIETNVENPRANYYVQRAKASLELKRFSDVFADTDRALALQPNNAKAYALQGYAHYHSMGMLRRQSQMRYHDRAQKIQMRLRSAFNALSKARELEPGLMENDTFRKHWEECEREWVVLDSPAQEAPPFLSSIMNASGNPGRSDQKEPRSEEAILARVHATSLLVPVLEDSVLLKSELLFFIASLTPSSFSSHHKIFIDTVLNVRRIQDFRASLLTTEQKVSYDAQAKSWQLDRQIWIDGTRNATSVGEIFICIRTLYGSIKSQALETRPDHIAERVSSLVKDLEAFGDENLGTAHQGECRELRLSLINRCLRMLPLDYACTLKLFKAEILLAENNLQESVAVVNEIVEAYNSGFCARSDLDRALVIRKEAVEMLGSNGESLKGLALVQPQSKSVLMSSLGTVQGNKTLVASQQVSVTDDSAFESWKKLPETEASQSLCFTMADLEKKLPGATLRRINGMLQSIGSTSDLLEAYRHPKLAESSDWSHLEPLSPETETPVVTGLTSTLQQMFPEEREMWLNFEHVTSAVRTQTLVLEDLVMGDSIQKHGPCRFTPYVKSSARLSSDLNLDGGETETEAKVLAERECLPADFTHESVTNGWNKRIKIPFLSSSLQSETDFVSTSAQLLSADAYFVILNKKDPLYSGIVVSELCAKVCHVDRPMVYVGRCLMKNECGNSCCLGSDVVHNGPCIERTGKLSWRMSSEPEVELRSFMRKRPDGFLRAVVDSLLRYEDGDVLSRRYRKALDEARRMDATLCKWERQKWAIEQVHRCLASTMPALKRVIAQYDPRHLKEVEEFIVSFVLLNTHVRLVPRGARYEGDPLNIAISICEALIADRSVARNMLAEAQSLLAMQEEQLSNLSPGSFAGGVYDMSTLRLFAGEEFARQQSNVVVANQRAVFCETRLEEICTLLTMVCLSTFKRYHSELRDIATEALAQLSSAELSHICEEISLSESDRNLIEQVRGEESEGHVYFERDAAVYVGRRAAETLRNYPRGSPEMLITLDATDFAWDNLRTSMEEALLFMVKVRVALELGKMHNGPLIQLISGHKILDELEQGMQRQTQAFVEASITERWRRAEFMRYIHVRNQGFYEAIAEIIRERVSEMQRNAERDRVLRELLDEEMETKRKSEDKKRKKPGVSTSSKNTGRNSQSNKDNGVSEEALIPMSASDPSTSPEPSENAPLRESPRNEEYSTPVSKEKQEESTVMVPKTTSMKESDTERDNVGNGVENDDDWIVVGSNRRKDLNESGAGNKTSSRKPSTSEQSRDKKSSTQPGKRSNTPGSLAQKSESNNRKQKGSIKGDAHNGGGKKASLSNHRQNAEQLPTEPPKNSEGRDDQTHEDHVAGLILPSEIQTTENVRNVDSNQSATVAENPSASETDESITVAEIDLDGEPIDTKQSVEQYKNNIEFGGFDAEEDPDTHPNLATVDPVQPSPVVPNGPGVVPLPDLSKPVHVMTRAGEAVVPQGWVCPITHDVMSNPILAADGYNYEHGAFMHWLASSRLSPVTGQPLPDDRFTPNLGLQAQIQESMSRWFPPAPPPVPMPHRPICIYYQQGTCRYGPGCRNLHINIPYAPFPVIPTGPPPQPFLSPFPGIPLPPQ